MTHFNLFLLSGIFGAVNTHNFATMQLFERVACQVGFLRVHRAEIIWRYELICILHGTYILLLMILILIILFKVLFKSNSCRQIICVPDQCFEADYFYWVTFGKLR